MSIGNDSIFSTEPFATVEFGKKPENCTYCNKNVNANCHAHKNGCIYSCNYDNDVPVGDGLMTLMLLIVIYSIFKKRR